MVLFGLWRYLSFSLTSLDSLSLLFQRGIYPPEDFKMVKRYGLNILVSADENVKSYLKKVLSQIEGKIE